MNRLPVIAAVAAGLLIGGLPPAIAAAAPDAAPCTQWGFNGATSLQMEKSDIGTISFYAKGPSLGFSIPATNESGVGNGSVPSQILGTVTGGIIGDQIDVTFIGLPQMGSLQMDGQISPDGSAHGTADGGSIKWHSWSPLKCMSNATSGTPSA